MMSLYLILILFVLLGTRRQTPGKIFDRSDTKSLQGLFAVVILIHHILTWIISTHGGNSELNGIIGTVGVGAFFMISAYGLMKSSIEKPYEKRMFLSRIPKLYFEFVFVNIIYFFAVYLGQKPITIGEFFIKLFGLELFFGIDNMNMYAWFIVTILIIYIVFGLILLLSRLYKRNKYVTATLFTLAVILLYFLVLKLNLNGLYIRALLCFPIGVWYATLEKYINRALSNWWSFGAVAIILLAMIIVSYVEKFGVGVVDYGNLVAMLICVLVIVLNQKFTLKKSRVWNFFGKYSLEIYLMEFVALRTLAFLRFDFPVLFAISGFVFNLLLAYILSLVFESIFKAIDKRKASLLRKKIRN